MQNEPERAATLRFLYKMRKLQFIGQIEQADVGTVVRRAANHK